MHTSSSLFRLSRYLPRCLIRYEQSAVSAGGVSLSSLFSFFFWGGLRAHLACALGLCTWLMHLACIVGLSFGNIHQNLLVSRMPNIRVRIPNAFSMADEQPPSPRHFAGYGDVKLPDIAPDDAFHDVVRKTSSYITDVVYMPATFEQLRTTSAGDALHTLVDHMCLQVRNPAVVNALLALKWHYGAISDSRGLSNARANACEIVAWRFLTHLSEREAVEFCLYEIPDSRPKTGAPTDEEAHIEQQHHERTALLGGATRAATPDYSHWSEYINGPIRRSELFESISKLTMSRESTDMEGIADDPTAPFIHLNALEIAAIADAKRFLSQHVVQKIITGIWNGDIIFWNRLAATSVKKPRFYDHRTADPFSRLRVPKYLRAYEVAFFCGFLFLYYGVLIEQNRYAVTPLEVILYIWFAAFFYDEVSEYLDAGSIFYTADVWNAFDMIMMAIGIVYFILRCVGLYRKDYILVDISFDVLALEALFMVPRVFSILSLSPYWGTLIPCLKAMGLDFIKFMVLVAVVYLGFLTTFTLVGRDTFSFQHMAMIVTKIFFGASFVGFDTMYQIDPIFGPPLMFLLVTLSCILLTGSLTGILSNSFSRVTTHAREEYLYVYSVYVLEASTSNRLTHFYPPFNLLALIIFRPLRLFATGDTLRHGRIILLRATHAPIVGLIQLYEWLSCKISRGKTDEFREHRQCAPEGHIVSAPNRTRPYYGRPAPSPRPDSIEMGNKSTKQSLDKDDSTDIPSDIEVRIADLSAKIDHLTALVLAMQPAKPAET
ncbi:ion transporter [Xylaria sp. CBS 124048]|nr:ion transporter [Xylaria sp. CBS 124048]